MHCRLFVSCRSRLRLKSPASRLAGVGLVFVQTVSLGSCRIRVVRWAIRRTTLRLRREPGGLPGRCSPATYDGLYADRLVLTLINGPLESTKLEAMRSDGESVRRPPARASVPQV